MSPETREHIFIVEDNEIYSMMLDYVLSKESVYKFSNFKTGEECIRNLYQNPDVVILDYSLPGRNGYEVLQEIKRYNPDICVMMLTSNDNKQLEEKLLLAGADDYILKKGHGEKQIVDKIDFLLSLKDRNESINAEATRRSFVKRMFYVALIIVGVLAGIVFLKLQ